MRLQGTHTLNAPPQKVWDLLMDAEVLAKITPGVSKLERIEGDQYKAISEVKIGPVKGSFKGDLEVADKVEPESFNLRVKQKSKIGNADASVAINLQPTGAKQTALTFDGKAKLSGTLARTGSRVLSGVANSMTQQFFSALEEEIEATKEPEPEPQNNVKTVETVAASAATASTSQKSTSLWTRFINWLKNLFGN